MDTAFMKIVREDSPLLVTCENTSSIARRNGSDACCHYTAVPVSSSSCYDDQSLDQLETQSNRETLEHAERDFVLSSKSSSTVSENDSSRDAPNVKLVISNTPIWAYILLLASVLANASVGPVLELEVGATPSMKVTWRMLGTFLVVLPFMIREIYCDGFPILVSSEWVIVAMAAFLYNATVLTFCFAVAYTEVGTAVILGNALAIIVLLGRLMGGYPVCKMEIIGAVVAMTGATLCSQEVRGNHPVGGSPYLRLAWFGNTMGILCSFCGVGYLLCAKRSRKNLSLGIFTGFVMLVSTIVMWWFQVYVLGEVVTWDANRVHGIWGGFRLEMDRLPVEAALVLFCDGFGTIGYVVITQYVDTLVITSTGLLQPVLSEFLAYGFGVGDLPGTQGWIGNVLVALGTLAVVTNNTGPVLD